MQSTKYELNVEWSNGQPTLDLDISNVCLAITLWLTDLILACTCSCYSLAVIVMVHCTCVDCSVDKWLVAAVQPVNVTVTSIHSQWELFISQEKIYSQEGMCVN